MRTGAHSAGLSGEMKEFFDRSYYTMFEVSGGSDGGGEGGGSCDSCGDEGGSSSGGSSSGSYAETSRLLGKPYGLAIAAGSDGSSAARQASGNSAHPPTHTLLCPLEPPRVASLNADTFHCCYYMLTPFIVAGDV